MQQTDFLKIINLLEYQKAFKSANEFAKVPHHYQEAILKMIKAMEKDNQPVGNIAFHVEHDVSGILDPFETMDTWKPRCEQYLEGEQVTMIVVDDVVAEEGQC